MTVIVRDLQHSDIAAVGDLFDRYRQFYEQPPDPALAREFIAQRVTRAESVILVAQTAAGDLVGFCQLYPSFCSVMAQPIYVLYDLFVAGSARRQGAGKALLKTAEARAAADGKTRMDLATARSNATAQALYESMGWVRDDVFLHYSRAIAPA